MKPWQGCAVLSSTLGGGMKLWQGCVVLNSTLSDGKMSLGGGETSGSSMSTSTTLPRLAFHRFTGTQGSD